MRQFAALYDTIDATTATSEKVAALVAYFNAAAAPDAAWAVAFLLGRRPKRLVRAPDLRAWAAQAADVPAWLFEECYAQAGDLAETISLLVPESDANHAHTLAWWVEERLLPLARMDGDVQRDALRHAWEALNGTSRFLFNKLLTGSFRVGVSDGLVVRALAQVSGINAETIAHRLMGQWEPSAAWFTQLVATETTDADWSRPYPFYLAYPLEAELESLGAPDEWQLEWKWDGIRAQLVRRRGRTFLWSRGEELLADRFPEVEASATWLPDGTVLDGELLAWRDGKPLPFSELQRRIGRKTVGKKLLADVPCHLLVYDCLEADGVDVRDRPMHDRRALAVSIVSRLPGGASMGMSPVLDVSSWSSARDARERSRDMQAEGLMLKRRVSHYGVGRKVGDWWKWKVNPLTVDAVLVYAQAGHGRRAGLFTDYTFAIWDGDALVPFAKAYSGLTDAEIREVDAFVRRNTLEKFGPVRTVKPELVFELAFEGIQRSTRHKSGIAVRFPRMARWRRDKPASEADTLDTVKALLHSEPAGE
ncbi:ATP-dependent DNA ligase [Gemmatimonas sp.]|uniref:ATP-dependent DNA ligase n=1 Tax=Gemmatimonas sp. TaxID=1962908 RepID=UPI00286B8860|nr:ATP-dependent DNA ligase [Gemmatimonas sp.]